MLYINIQQGLLVQILAEHLPDVISFSCNDFIPVLISIQQIWNETPFFGNESALFTILKIFIPKKQVFIPNLYIILVIFDISGWEEQGT
jgi:hypothetical protein